jgi:hypothetical protein
MFSILPVQLFKTPIPMKGLFTFILMLAITGCFAQTTQKKLYILRPYRWNSSAIKMKLLVNGRIISFRNNSMAEIPVTNDSVSIQVLGKRYSKYSQRVAISALQETYFIANFSTVKDKRLQDVVLLTQVAQDCFELKQKNHNQPRTASL